MPVLPIVTYGHPTLRKKGEIVSNFTPALKKLADDMVETMRLAEGIGLAAQQVDLAVQFCVIDLRGGDWTFNWELNGTRPPLELIMPMVLVNPVVTPEPQPITTVSEGCLSFPDLNGDVDRPDRIEVRFQDLDGHDNTLICDGMFSRCIQHEVDHLNGILYIDRMQRDSLAAIDRELKQLKKRTRRELKKRN
jgi:peptide deformylase